MLFQDRDAGMDACITDIYGRARHKLPDLFGVSAAERTPQSRPRALAQPVRDIHELLRPHSQLPLSTIRAGGTVQHAFETKRAFETISVPA
jgi:hypothetical protein